MIDKNKKYTLRELLNSFNMYNIEFKFYGNNDKGDLEVYLKTDVDKMSVFRSITKQTKLDYLKLNEDSAKNVKFKFDREVDELELDIVAIVLRTSDINIPSTKYTLKTLDRLTREQDLEERKSVNDLHDGIVYTIVDNNTGCTLYDNVYLFDKNKEGLMKELEKEYENENDSLLKNNLKIILDYYNSLSNERII